MPRTKKTPSLRNRTQRAALPNSKNGEPYWFLIAEGKHIGYRKSERGSTWVARYYTTEHGRRSEKLGAADDISEANGKDVLSFDQAQASATAWIERVNKADSGEAVEDTTPKISYTVADALDRYLIDKEREKRKGQERARIIVESHIKPHLGAIPLAKLKHTRVREWRDTLAAAAPRVRSKAGSAPAHREVDLSDPDVQRQRQATVNRILTVLKAALNHAKEELRWISTAEGWEDVKAFRRVDVPKVRFLTEDEVTAFTPGCEPSFGALVKGALLTGCRFGELAIMHVEEFKHTMGSVYVRESKNGEARYVGLNDEGVSFFAALTANRDPKDFIFLKANGKPWLKSEQKRPMDAACELAKLEGVTFHILRHTYASHAVMNGMPLAVLSAQLGHKDTRVTERHYAHLAQTYKQKLIRENAPSFGFGASKAGPQLVQSAS